MTTRNVRVPWSLPRFRIGFSPSRDSPLLNDVSNSSVVVDREEEKGRVRPNRASAARFVAGGLGRGANGPAPAAMTGRRSAQEASARYGFAGGRKRPAFLPTDRRRIRSSV